MSAPRVHVVGVAPGAGELPEETCAVIRGCALLAGAPRHLALVPGFAGEVCALDAGVAALVQRIADTPGLRAAVLASGDPGFFGVAGLLLRQLPRDEVCLWPAVSAMQLAFARAGETWQEARFASLHGRPLENLAAVLGAPKVGLFTDAANGPREIAWFLAEAGWGDLTMVVAEDLGLATERVTRAPPEAFLEWRGSSLNVVLLLRRGDDRRPLAPGLPEAEFSHARGLITKREVRAVALGLLQLPRGGVFWDVGAGSGSVSVEACLLRPCLRAYAVEKSAEGLAHLRENRRRFRVAGLVPVAGQAPHALEGLPAPDAVYVGGSGGALAGILDASWQRLRPGGTLVVAAVLLETLCGALDWTRTAGVEAQLTEVAVSRSRPVAGRTRRDPQTPISLVWVTKPPLEVGP